MCPDVGVDKQRRSRLWRREWLHRTGENGSKQVKRPGYTGQGAGNDATNGFVVRLDTDHVTRASLHARDRRVICVVIGRLTVSVNRRPMHVLARVGTHAGVHMKPGRRR